MGEGLGFMGSNRRGRVGKLGQTGDYNLGGLWDVGVVSDSLVTLLWSD